MGMFDTIWQKVKCPNCKKVSEIGLQTKSGQRVLANYKLGDKFSFNKESFTDEKHLVNYHSKPKYLIWLLGSCRKCGCQMSGCAWINKKSFIIEEINLSSYTVEIEPKKIYIAKKSKKNGAR